MPNIEPHGGGCCGVRHIRGFTTNRPSQQEKDVFVRMIQATRLTGRVFECILRLGQVRAWGAFLVEIGFWKVTSFRNGNTGNVLTIYHFVTPDAIIPLEDTEEAPLGKPGAANVFDVKVEADKPRALLSPFGGLPVPPGARARITNVNAYEYNRIAVITSTERDSRGRIKTTISVAPSSLEIV